MSEYRDKLMAVMTALGNIDALIPEATKAAREAGLTDLCDHLEYFSDEGNEYMDRIRDMLMAVRKAERKKS